MFTGAGAGAGATGSGGSALFCCGAWIRLVGASSPVEGVDDTHRRNIWKVEQSHGGSNITGSESEYDLESASYSQLVVAFLFHFMLRHFQVSVGTNASHHKGTSLSPCQ